MVYIPRFILSLLWALESPIPNETESNRAGGRASKSIAIIGAGTAGLSTLKTILDIPEETRADWNIVIFEKRWDVGGAWLPDSKESKPPHLPDTPLYPSLHTISPHPTMTFPRTNLVFPPGTPILASHEFVEDYHRLFAEHYSIRSYIKFNHTVISTSWNGSSEQGYWNITTNATLSGRIEHFRFDHLVIAAGRLHYPTSPSFDGLQDWLDTSSKRKALHSVYYRLPEPFVGKNVLVIGGGPSGRDIAAQVASVANITYHSAKPRGSVNITVPGTISKPQTMRMNCTSVTFMDGSAISDVDSVILANGFDLKYPFLTLGNELAVVPIPDDPAQHDDDHLSTNLRYIRPLHEHVLSLSSQHPLGSLYFVGLTTQTYYAANDVAQSLFVAHTIANPDLLNIHNKTLLPPNRARQEYLRILRSREDTLRAHGVNPDIQGHQSWGSPLDYQNDMVEWLKERGVKGLPDGEYVEPWRKEAHDNRLYIVDAWHKIVALGPREEQKWLEGVRTESDWAELMRRLAEWSRRELCSSGGDSPQPSALK